VVADSGGLVGVCIVGGIVAVVPGVSGTPFIHLRSG
jgi:hypothetical protein